MHIRTRKHQPTCPKHSPRLPCTRKATPLKNPLRLSLRQKSCTTRPHFTLTAEGSTQNTSPSRRYPSPQHAKERVGPFHMWFDSTCQTAWKRLDPHQELPADLVVQLHGLAHAHLAPFN
eukprot:591885-Amphidinium_carterae.1